MASYLRYVWRSGDDIWRVALHYLTQSGYPDVSTFVEHIRLLNPTILDWAAVPPLTQIVLPLVGS